MYTQETTCEIPEIPIVNGKTLRRAPVVFWCRACLKQLAWLNESAFGQALETGSCCYSPPVSA